MRETKTINYNTVVVRKDGIDATDMDSEKVMMDIDKGKYFVLNEVASDIWESIAKPISVKNIIDSLMKTYIVDEKQCFDSTMEFIKRLENEDMVLIRS